MEKKYQVFISSTFIDLSDERKKVLDILLMADCIPAGMEAFVATDEEQFNVIRKVIDLCDYYILIIGGRYGSINEATGISYTEMEYEYALSKGIPALVFSIDDSVKLDGDKFESDIIKRGKLAEFKSKAMRNRLASVWKDSSDLIGKVAISIMAAKQQIDRPGWSRGGVDQNELLKQIFELKSENEVLKKKINTNSIDSIVSQSKELPFYGFKISLHYTEEVYLFTSSTKINHKLVETTLDEMFKFIALRLTGIQRATKFIDAVSAFVPGYYVDEQEALILKNQYTQLGFLQSKKNTVGDELIELTEKGILVTNEFNALK